MRRISIEERRARLARRHHLALGASESGPVEVAGNLVGLHGTDAATVYLALWARVSGFRTAALEHALYGERTLVRMLGMRRTMFVLPTELAPLVQAACTESIAVTERRRLRQQLEQAGIAADVDHWLGEVEAATLQALGRRGEATASELAAEVSALREQLSFGEGTRWAGSQGV